MTIQIQPDLGDNIFSGMKCGVVSYFAVSSKVVTLWSHVLTCAHVLFAAGYLSYIRSPLLYCLVFVHFVHKLVVRK